MRGVSATPATGIIAMGSSTTSRRDSALSAVRRRNSRLKTIVRGSVRGRGGHPLRDPGIVTSATEMRGHQPLQQLHAMFASLAWRTW